MHPPLMRALEMVGSDLDLFGCPWCGSHDRERHVYMYLNALSILDDISNMHILHFAPERILSQYIEKREPKKYIKADLFPTSDDVLKIDLLDIPIDTCSIDILFANHILEHVIDDLRALSEIYRVLRPGGYAILQTPYSNMLKHTWSDSGVSSPEARLHAYGQEDHVRLYGKDIFDRFEMAGLKSCVRTHESVLSHIDRFEYGINSSEPFFLFQRPAL